MPDEPAETYPPLNPRESAVLGESVRKHLAACQAEIDWLASYHREMGEGLNHEDPDSQPWVAAWLMAGRCLTLSNAFLDQQVRGFSVESMVTARAVHEGCEALRCFLAELQLDERGDAARWRVWLLDQDRIRPSEYQDVWNALEEKLHDLMRADGVEPFGRMRDPSARLYDHLSRAGHNRRSSFRERISVGPSPRFAYGPHPDTQVAASCANYANGLIGMLLLDLGDLLQLAAGESGLREEIKQRVDRLGALKEEQPISLSRRRQTGEEER